MDNGYVNGFIERTKDGAYHGNLTVEHIDLSPIEGVYFKQDGDMFLWIKRRPIMEFDYDTQSYRTRKRTPPIEAYLKKQKDGDTVAYRGEFTFMRFRFSVVGVWDTVFGKERQRLNLFVERLPMSQQTIINSVNERKRNG